jgi:hypothetical protein
MASFLNLDSAQLNRHIAHAVSTAERARFREMDGQTSLSKQAGEKSRTISDGLPRLNPSTLKNALMVLWVIGVYMFLGYQLWPALSGLNSGVISREVVSSISAEQPVPTTTACPGPSSTSYVSGQESKAVQQIPDPSSTKVPPVLAEDPAQFQIGIAGGNQLLVKLPKVALSHKGRSKLTVELRRNKRIVPAAIQELFEGVVTVQLLPHDAYGDIEVNLTMSRPKLSEIVNVAFGDRYQIFEGYHLRDRLSTVQRDVQAKVSNMSTSLQAIGRRLVSDRFQTLSRLAQERLHQRRSRNSVRWMNLVDLKMAILEYKIHRKMQDLHDSVVQRKKDCFTQGRMLIDALSTKYADAHSRIVDIIESANQRRVRPTLDHTAVVDKLETARARAYRIVSSAAAKLRARGEGA